MSDLVVIKDHQAAAELATAAGALLLHLRGSGPTGGDLKALGDERSHQYLMAELAGMRLPDRLSGWKREPFTSESRKHVSIWEKPAPR